MGKHPATEPSLHRHHPNREHPMALPTKSDLAKLPRRAIVAYAARCAQPLFDLPQDHSDRMEHLLACVWAVEMIDVSGNLNEEIRLAFHSFADHAWSKAA